MSERLMWGPKRPLVWLTAAATIGAAVAATLYSRTGDGRGAVLLWLAAVLFALMTAYGSLLNPRLIADADGVVIRRLAGGQRVPWSELQARVKVTRRLGRDGRTLELEFRADGSQQLVVLGQLELGADPDDVLAALTRLRT
jgi:hypothetical protein